MGAPDYLHASVQSRVGYTHVQMLDPDYEPLAVIAYLGI